jgi:hypothetical protein
MEAIITVVDAARKLVFCGLRRLLPAKPQSR